MNKFDEFYPISETMKSGNGIWMFGLVIKMRDHLKKAKTGDREAESRLINRLGQLHRNMESTESFTQDLQDQILASVVWLRSIGRKVNFGNPNPGLWITARNGKTPRF